MKTTVYEFTPPKIVGALGNATLEPKFAKAMEREIKKRNFFAVCLPFQVEAKHLKNVVACMHLMDVVGLTVHPVHQRRIIKHLDRTERLASEIGFVDTIARRGSKLVGMNAWARALQELVGDDKKRPVIIIGSDWQALAAAKALKKYPTRRVKNNPSDLAKKIPRGALIIDFEEKAKRLKYKKIIPGATWDRTQRRISADLILSSIF
jgi:shikimate 5-dehydrogenase